MEYTICGAGIAGLYTAYKILLANPDAKVTIYEKNNYIGGRMHVASFAGAHVPIGAGIGRKAKDTILLELLDKLNIKYNTGIASSQHIGHTQINIQAYVNKLITAYKSNPVHETFKVFAHRYLSNQEYNNFVINTGYNDFENADVYEVLYYYGFDDTYDGWTTVYIPWNDLIKKLVTFIKDRGGHIKLRHTVTKFTENILYITREKSVDHNTYNTQNIKIDTKYPINATHKLIIGTTLSNLRELLPTVPVYKYLGATPFMRIYGQFSKKSRKIVSSYIPKLTLVNAPIQEIIPINPEKGVYMIVYNDSANAVKMHNKLSALNQTSTTITSNDIGAQTPKYNRACMDYLEKLIASALEINTVDVELNKIVVYFWREGTHYTKPLPAKYKNFDAFIYEVQRPCQNVYVVGEAVAKHKGWSEGVLESVENIITEIM